MAIFGNEEYQKLGARIVDKAADVFAGAEMIVKVKEPLPEEYPFLRPGLTLFTYLHLAAAPDLANELLAKKVTTIAYETVQLPDGNLPLLTPMSEIAGRLAVQVGAHYLERPYGGSGKLLGGVPGVSPCLVLILGAGIVGANAAQIALGMGARVVLMTRSVEKLRTLSQVLHGNLETLSLSPQAVHDIIPDVDLLIGAVLAPGDRAPILVSRADVASMSPGSVIVDVSVDQGGCVETTPPTSHSAPIYIEHGIVHYCVTNMPGSVPQTSTLALSSATLPYIIYLANRGIERAIRENTALAHGVNTYAGQVTNQGVARALGLQAVAIDDAMSA